MSVLGQASALPPLEQEDRDLEGAAGGQEGGAGPKVVQVVVERALGGDFLVLGGEVQGDHDHEGVEAGADDHGDRVEHRGVHDLGRGSVQHAEGVDAVEHAEDQRDAGRQVHQVAAQRLTGGADLAHEALEAHLGGDLVGPELLALGGEVAALLVGQMVSLDGALVRVGAALEAFDRLVVDGRFVDARDMHQLVTGAEHELLASADRRAVVLAMRHRGRAFRLVAGQEGRVQGLAGVEAVVAHDAAVVATTLLAQVVGDAGTQGMRDVVPRASTAVAVGVEASVLSGDDGLDVCDLGHVIAFSVSGLSTERI